MFDVSQDVSMICPWMGSDLISIYTDTFTAANGGSGLITQHGLRKPIYYAIQFLNSLGLNILYSFDNCLVTDDGWDGLYILFHNYQWFDKNYFVDTENIANPTDIDYLFDNSTLNIKLKINGLIDQKNYIAKHRLINSENGSILNEWKKLHYEAKLSKSDIDYLDQKSIPTLKLNKIKSKLGSCELNIKLENQEFRLIHFYSI